MNNIFPEKPTSQLWGIEIKEGGVWNDYFYENSLLDALHKASKLVHTTREEYIRIISPDNKIL